MIFSILAMALREIRRHLMRSALTTLGIVIGVAAVVALVTLGRATTQKVTSDVAKMGHALLIVSPRMPSHGRGAPAKAFDLADVRAIQREISSLRAVAPTVGAGVLAVNGSENHSTTVTGSSAEYFEVRGFELAAGRLFTRAEEASGRSVCVVGETVRDKLFGGQDPIGAQIRLGALPCEVVGLLEAKGQSTVGPDQDDVIVMPLRAVQRRLRGNDDVQAIFVGAANDGAIDRVKSSLESLFRERRRVLPGQQDDFIVRDTREIAEMLSSITGTLTALLGAIAAVSLLVGGIGIMNIMLVSVTERTREIGIRMAIGARAGEVLLQFLLEAVVLSVLGGCAGMALGLLGSWAATAALGMPFVLVPSILVVAFLFSAAVGVGFGYLPARKAARLHPIQALRYE